MKQFYVLVLFVFLIVITAMLACITTENEPEPRVRFTLDEVPGGNLRLVESKVLSLSNLMREAYLPMDEKYPLKEVCVIRPQVVYLYSLRVEGDEKVSADEILAEMNRKELKPVNLCLLVALTKHYRLQVENVVALESYRSSSEMCARAYINKDNEKKELKLSRKACPDKFSGNAIFAVVY